MSMRTKEFRLVLTILLVLLGMQAKAEDRVVIQSATITAGEEFTLPIELVNEFQYKGFQMDIELPDGISPVYNKRGKIVPEKTDRLEDSHSFSYNEVGNVVKLVCTSMSGDVTWGNSGTLFSIQLKADDNLQGGTYDIKVTGIKFTDEDNTGHTFADVMATFTILDICTYTFVANGETLASGQLMPGENLDAPEAPAKTGYTFKGWSPAFTGTMPANSVTYKAVYEPNPYKVTWVIDGTQFTETINCDAKIGTPNVPAKEGYTFTGWTPEVPATMPAEDMTFTAQFAINSYWVTFMAEGIEVSKTEMAYGSPIVAPNAPSLPGKSFLYWSPDVLATVPAYDVIFKAVYGEAVLDTVYTSNMTVNAGETFSLPVGLINVNTFVGFQMDIVLPQGITPVLTQKGKLVIAKTDRLEDSHNFSFNYLAEDNTVKLVCTSMASDELYGNTGELFTIDLQAAEDIDAGNYDIILANVRFSTSSSAIGGAQPFNLANAKATITVTDEGRIERLQALLADQIAAANALLDSAKIYGEIRTQINAAIQQYINAADVNTLEEAVSLMQQLLDNANDYIQMYFQLSAALERLNGMLVDNGVRDPEILKNAQNYYNTIIAGFNAETLNYESALRAIELINSYISQLNKVALTINVEQAGTLANLISQQVDDYSGIVSLTVTGFLNSNDLSAIRILKDNLVTLNLEETNLTTIGYEALCSMVALKTIILPKNLNTIGEFAFNYCALENITFPASLRTISNYAFYYCFALKNVELPEGVTSLGYCSFGQCEQLKEVVLPSSITKVDRSFLYSNQITKITCKAVVPPYTDGNLMGGNEYLCTLEVPVISVQSYIDNYYWSMFNIVGGSYYGDNMMITSDITFNSNDSILQTLKPSINVTRADNNWNSSYGALSVVGTNTLSLTGYEMFFDAYMAQSEKYRGNYSRYSATLINQAPMRADNVAVKLRLNAYQWYFVCLPFDVKVSTITPDRDTQFVIYKYDGKRRGDGDMANTWVKMTADSTLHAGIGYIWQTASAYVENMGEYYDITFSVKALNNSNKNNIFRNGDVQVKLSEYASELPHNRSWNLVGNPYPAYFNSRAMDINAPFTVWSVNNQNYEAFSPVDDHYVFAPGEAFFIQRPMDQATIPFLAAGRQNNAYQTDSVFFNNARQSVMPAKRSVFNLLLQLDNKTVDRTRVVINEEAILGYESDKDAAKFEAMSKVSQLYTLEGGQRYAINERPADRGQMQLGAEFAMKATYTLVLETTVDEKVYLVDRLTGAEVLLNENGYTFDAEAGIANDRFMVRIATDETTGIKTIDSLNSEGTYYDLRGVRVEKPHKGLYINNGKKTVVK